MTTATPSAIPMARSWHDDDDLRAVEAVLVSGVLTGGPVVEAFEAGVARFLGAEQAVAVNSGTAALELALRASGVGPGDEVIVPTFTYIASAAAVAAVGATPVLVDIRPDQPTVDPAAVDAAVGPRTVAVIAVHLYGHPAETGSIAAVATRRGILVIDDAAQAFGAVDAGRMVGSTGTACLSFHASKHLSTGEGGMVVTDDAAFADRLRRGRDHGTVGACLHASLGSNHRLSATSAAIGTVQVGRQQAWLARRRAVAAQLGAGLPQVAIPPRAGAEPSWMSFPLRIGPRRDMVLDALRHGGIDARSYYPRTLHEQPGLEGVARRMPAPVAARAARELLCLPCHPHLSDEDVERVIGVVASAVASG